MKFFQRFLVCLFLFSVLVCSAFAQPIVKVSVLRPSDQPVVYQHEIDNIREAMIEIQSFFASEMDRLGYGKKTFEFETHIPVYIGARELSFYQEADDVRWQQGRVLSEFPDDIHLVFLAGASSVNNGAAGVFTHRCNDSGECNFKRLVVTLLADRVGYRNRVTAHELGHAFGFHEHLNTGKNYVMEEALPIIPGEGHLLNFQLHPDVAKTLNASDDLSVNNDVDTSKFDRIVRRPDDPETDPSHDGGNTDLNAPLLPNLVAYYPFDGNADDASGNGNHGQGTGSINYVDGKFGKALELSNGEYIEMEATDTLHGDIFKASPFTLSAWIYPELSTDYGHVWRSRSPATAGHTLFIMRDGSISWRARINGEWSWGDLCETKPGIVKANEWIHVAVTNDGGKIRIYANSNLVAETDFQETDGKNTTYSIGSRFIYQEAFAGWIDDFALFSSALSEGEIKRIIQVGVKQFIHSSNDNSDIDADVNDDGYVDLYDVLIVRSGMSAEVSYDTDVNNDGVTDEVDLLIVKAKAMEAIAAAAPRKRKVNITTWGRLKRQ